MSVSIKETQTPSMDILKQQTERIVDPMNRGQRIRVAPTRAQKLRFGSGKPRMHAPSAAVMSDLRAPKRSAIKSRNPRTNLVNRPAVNYAYDDLNAGFNGDNYVNHTISSAIKADYGQPDVKFKLDELNKSVKKTRVVKRIPSRKRTLVEHDKPFVVRKVIINILSLLNDCIQKSELKNKQT